MMTASTTSASPSTTRYAQAVETSKRVRWNIDTDVIRGRTFSPIEKFLPDGLSLAGEAGLQNDDERAFFSRVQGRTYANIFGLVERFINAKVLTLSEKYFFGDQVALEALVRFSDEELKHQELFRRIEVLAEQCMPTGYSFAPNPNDVAHVVLGKSTWSVLALTCLIELFTQAHYKESIESDARLSPLFKDVFRAHWLEESQHAILDELEWIAEDARITPEERDEAVSDLIALVAAVDGILKAQSESDAAYFASNVGRAMTAEEKETARTTLRRAYRHQYIFSGLERTKFIAILKKQITDAQFERIGSALATLK